MKSDGMKLLVSGDQSSSTIAPDSDEFTGFVFKLQANLDPRHRDRMAFIRVCSGTFRKGMKVGHSRMKKTINLSSAQRYHISSDHFYNGHILSIEAFHSHIPYQCNLLI